MGGAARAREGLGREGGERAPACASFSETRREAAWDVRARPAPAAFERHNVVAPWPAPPPRASRQRPRVLDGLLPESHASLGGPHLLSHVKSLPVHAVSNRVRSRVHLSPSRAYYGSPRSPQKEKIPEGLEPPGDKRHVLHRLPCGLRSRPPFPLPVEGGERRDLWRLQRNTHTPLRPSHLHPSLLSFYHSAQ